MIKTYKFRIYPTVAQVEILENTLNTCRFLYNDCLADRKNAYERTGITIGCVEMFVRASMNQEARL